MGSAIISDDGEDDVGLGGDGEGRGGKVASEVEEWLGFRRSAVEDGEGVAGSDQVGAHGPDHDSGLDPPDSCARWVDWVRSYRRHGAAEQRRRRGLESSIRAILEKKRLIGPSYVVVLTKTRKYEGAARRGGRGPSIWDTFTHKYPERIYDGGNGDVAIDFYHRYKEDVKIMKDMGLDAFRFSISWSRVLPSGKLSGGVNKEGINFYNNLINELLQNGIKPFVTIFHWDPPQALEDEYGGFLSPHIVNDFEDFAEVCFREFGDRVKHWITMNAPDIYAKLAYDTGDYAPGRCSQWKSRACEAGNSTTEPYIVAHHLLLSHAVVATLYKQKYQASQKGEIGLTMSVDWVIPYSNTTTDSEAATRAIDFTFGWFVEPLTYGDYPSSMRTLVGKRLPKLTTIQSKMVKGSFDFIGINYYSTQYASNIPSPNLVNISYSTDSLASITGVRNGIPIGPQAASSWIYSYPRGLHDLLIYTKEKYNNPTIYITENGFDEYNNSTLPLNEALQDPTRIAYHHDHLVFLQRAIVEGVKVKGYFAWSLFDNFEWCLSYTVRFGFNFVDFKDGLKRYPKQSAIWFKKFLMKQAQYDDY